MTSPSSSGALEAVERVLNRGGEPDAVLRYVVSALHERAAPWVGIAFVTEDGVELGPSAGGDKPVDVQRHPIVWEGRAVAELWAGIEADAELLARVALIVSPYCVNL